MSPRGRRQRVAEATLARPELVGNPGGRRRRARQEVVVVVVMVAAMPVVVVAAAAVIVVVVFEDGDAPDFDFYAFDDRSVEFDAF